MYPSTYTYTNIYVHTLFILYNVYYTGYFQYLRISKNQFPFPYMGVCI